MNTFMGNDLLLRTKEAKALYKTVKDLPIIDYHCHLDPEKIAKSAKYCDLSTDSVFCEKFIENISFES